MAEITLGGNPIHTNGDLPSVGSAAPSHTLTKANFSTVSSDLPPAAGRFCGATGELFGLFRNADRLPM
jgi:peroxiredoxin